MSVDDLGFNPDWLTERYPFDSKARNRYVEKNFLKYLAAFPTPVLVDLGCGNGANTKYFIDRIPTNHTWILVDNDQNLLNHALDNLRNLDGYEATDLPSSDGFILKKEGKQITIKTACGSLLELDQLLNLSSVDLLMANAVFDLFSEEQFTAFAAMLKANRLPILATLNYASMIFSPGVEHDPLFLDYYDLHMQRVQDFGRGMGYQCSEVMERVLQKLEAKTFTGPSNWEISAADTGMLNFLYHYLDDSLHELPFNEKEGQLLESWLAERRLAIDEGRLSVKVGHFDLFGYFN